MITIHPGEFWVADILFTDRSASKKRPVLVLWLDGADVVAAAVTSALPRTPMDVPLVDWRASGLRIASTVRLARLDCLEQSLSFPAWVLFPRRMPSVSAPPGTCTSNRNSDAAGHTFMARDETVEPLRGNEMQPAVAQEVL